MTFADRTESAAPVRKPERWLLAAILLIAAALRLRHIDFGLPSLNDPDEPIFVMTALDMLREARLNPGWFGHPATLLFYLLAIVIIAVGTTFGGDQTAFVAAVFADPGILVLPMRATMAALGVGSVAMTWAIGRRVGGARTGLVAALLLACNPLHVELSQVIRTDMLATLLMGWSMNRALSIARGGGVRDHVWAGVAAGLACATKWPAMLILAAPFAAGCWAARRGGGAWTRLAIAPIAAAAVLVIVSPYLLLDWQTVLRDLGGEARAVHPGATGYGIAGNLIWYLRHPLFESFGVGGALLAAIGLWRIRLHPEAAVVLLPAFLVLLLALAGQALVWARWAVPLLPMVSIVAALGAVALLERSRIAGAVLVAVAAIWATIDTVDRQSARAADPRQSASAWVIANVPRDRTILVEHAAFDLLAAGRALRFPLGSAGCVDVAGLLRRAPAHRDVNARRSGRAIVDVGNIDRARLGSCAADMLILSNHRRYAREPEAFAAQLGSYRTLLMDYRRVAVFAPDRNRTRPDPRPVEVFERRR